MASRLGVGSSRSPYRFGEVWGPASSGDPRPVLNDYEPDLDYSDYGRLAKLRERLVAGEQPPAGFEG